MRKHFLVLMAVASLPACQSNTLPSAPDFKVSSAENYQITGLGSLGADSISCKRSEANAINARGQVVGWSSIGHRTWICPRHAFLWEDGVITDLNTWGGLPSKQSTSASHINDRGQIVGGYTSPDFKGHAVLWQAGTMVELGSLGGGSSGASDLGPDGTVVGSSSTATGEWHAFLWRDGVMQDLGTLGGGYSSAGAVNPRGQVVGQSRTAAGELHAFLWQDGVMQDLGTLGGDSSVAVAINDAGAVTGHSRDSLGRLRAFHWRGGVMVDLGSALPDDAKTRGLTVNASGHVLGRVERLDDRRLTTTTAFLWTAGVTTHVTESFGYPGTTPVALNNQGQVAGYGRWCGSVTCNWAFVWADGVMTKLGALPGHFQSQARAMNQAGDVAGFSMGGSENVHAVIWRRAPNVVHAP